MQDTIKGSGTTHDTDKTLFQLPTKEELLLPTIGKSEGFSTTPECVEISKYHLGKRVGPPLFTFHVDDENDNELLACVKRDTAWSAADSLLKESKSLPIKCFEEYLPVSPHPPEYPICKIYLDEILIMMKELELS